MEAGIRDGIADETIYEKNITLDVAKRQPRRWKRPGFRFG